MGLGAFACGVGRTKKGFGAFEMGFGACLPGWGYQKGILEGLEGFGGFDGWQTAGSNAKKKLLGRALVPLPAGLGVPKRGLERLRCLCLRGSGYQKCIWRVWGFWKV